MNYSNTPSAVRQRIRRLPKILGEIVDTMRKRDAEHVIQYWRSGLLNNSFNLAPLSPATIQKKIKQKYSAPNNPLYGLGMDGAYTYIKGLRYFKTKNGYVVRMTGRHHDSKIDNKGLLMIHEYGCNLKNGRIPARPALHMAYEQLLKEIQQRDASVTDAINVYLKTGNDELLKRIKSRI